MSNTVYCQRASVPEYKQQCTSSTRLGLNQCCCKLVPFVPFVPRAQTRSSTDLAVALQSWCTALSPGPHITVRLFATGCTPNSHAQCQCCPIIAHSAVHCLVGIKLALRCMTIRTALRTIRRALQGGRALTMSQAAILGGAAARQYLRARAIACESALGANASRDACSGRACLRWQACAHAAAFCGECIAVRVHPQLHVPLLAHVLGGGALHSALHAAALGI